jgi:hypothetical protein
MLSPQEIDALFTVKKLVVPSIPERDLTVFEPIVYEPLHVPTLKKRIQPVLIVPEPVRPVAPIRPVVSLPVAPVRPLQPFTAEMRRERNRISAKKFRDRQFARLKELKFLLYGNENVQLPFEINRITLPPEIPRRQRAIMFSAISRKRRKLTLAFLESALALKCRA